MLNFQKAMACWQPFAGTGARAAPVHPKAEITRAFRNREWGKPDPPKQIKIPRVTKRRGGRLHGLGDDILVSILALLPRSSHASADAVSKKWRALVRNEALVGARRAFGGEAFVVAVGGRDDGSIHNNGRVSLLVDGKTWVECAPLPDPVTMHQAVFCAEELYVLGGNHAARMSFGVPESCGCVMIFSPPRNAWRASAPLQSARALPGLCSCSGEVYVVGGLDTKHKRGGWAGSYKDMGHISKLNPDSLVWTELPKMPYPVHETPCVTVGKEIYVIGGNVDLHDDMFKCGIVQIFDTEALAWRVLDVEAPVASAVPIAHGSTIYCLGGTSSGARPPRVLDFSTVDDEDSEDEDEDERYESPFQFLTDGTRPATARHAWAFDSPMTAEAWALDTTTGTWQQLTSAPKPHWGSGLYLDGGVIRDARDRKLNYHIETDTWSKKACRANLLVNHCQSANIASAHLPF